MKYVNSKIRPSANPRSIAGKWFSISQYTRFKKIKGGLASSNWKFRYRGKTYVLKSLTKYITKRDILFEYKITNYIRESGFNYSIPRILLSKEGLPFTKVGKDLYSVYEYIEGESGRNINVAYAKEIGAMIADLHSIIGLYRFGRAKRRIGYHTVEMLEKRLYNCKRLFEGKSDRLSKALMISYSWFFKEIEEIDLKYYNSLKIYSLHEDISPENILWKNGRITALIDFSNIGRYRNPFLMDLALAALFCCKTKIQKHYAMRLIKALFESYNSKITLKRNDAKALVSLMILVEAATLEFSYMEASKLGNMEGIKLVLGHMNAAKWLIDNRTEVENAMLS